MNSPSPNLCRRLLPQAFAIVLFGGPAVAAPTYLTDGHVDFGFAYETPDWDVHVHDESNDREFAPGDAVLVLGDNLLTPIPPGARFSFLGAPGTPVYLLPNTPQADRLYLGFGCEELNPADWSSNLSLRLSAVDGPGHFFAWDLDAFGNTRVRFNSGDGLGPADVYALVPGGHGHLNFAFDQAGEYQLTFEVSGEHALDGRKIGTGTYQLTVGAVPEPGTISLMGLGVAGLIGMFCRRRQVQCARSPRTLHP